MTMPTKAKAAPPAAAAVKSKQKQAAAADASAAAAAGPPASAAVITTVAPVAPVDAEAAFPRGGSGSGAALGRRSGRDGGAKHAVSRAGAAAEGRPDDGSLAFTAAGRARAAKGGPSFVEPLRHSALAPGAKLWGVVTTVTPGRVDVALPVGLRGSARGAGAAALPLLHARGAAPGPTTSPPLTDLYYPGQYVRCAVVDLPSGGRGERRVELTMVPAAVCAGLPPAAVLTPGAPVPAWVASEEDHGWVMEMGVPGVTAFLPRADGPLDPDTGRLRASLARGAQVECVVASAPPGRKDGQGGSSGGVVRLTAAPPAGSPGPPCKEPAGATLGGLVPGSLVTATVDRLLADGAALTLWGCLPATADGFHLPPGALAGPSALKEGARVRARIVHVDPDAKAVRLSLLPHLLARAPGPAADLPAPGTLLGGGGTDADAPAGTVARVDEGLGVLVDLGPAAGAAGAGTRLFGYAHISNAADGRTARLGRAFKVGAPVRAARVLGARPMDGLASLSLKATDVARALGSVADLKPGSAVEGTVEAADPARGLLVLLAPGVRARIPPEHLVPPGRSAAGAVARHPVGSALVGAVVWGVEGGAAGSAAPPRATLTLRKALANPKLAPLPGLAAALPGARTHGVVTGVSPSLGVFVSLYGGLTGLAGLGDLGLARGEAPGGAFEVGQLVKARVLSSDPGTGRVRLSLAPPSDAAAGDAAGAEELAAAAAAEAEAACGGWGVGEVVEAGAVVTAVEAGPDAAASGDGSTPPPPARFILALPPKAGHGGPPAAAALGAAHLADHPAAAAALRSALTVGATLGPLLILEKGAKGRGLVVTRKPAMVRAAREGGAGGGGDGGKAGAPPASALPSDPAAVQPGSVLPGFVASVTPDALFIRFLGRCTGRVGLAHAGDVLAPDAGDVAAVGDSVLVAVVSRDAARGRFGLSLRRADVGRDRARAAAGARLGDLFADLEVAAGLEAGGGSAAAAPYPPPGGVVAATVSGARPYGTLLDLPSLPDAVALAPGPRHNGGETAPPLPEGAPLTARVLDVAPLDGVVDVSLRPDLQVGGEGGCGRPKKRGAKATGAPAAASSLPAASAAGVAAAAAWSPGSTATATVELVRGEYLVCSLPPASGGGGGGGGGGSAATAAAAQPAPPATRALIFVPRPATPGVPIPTAGSIVEVAITASASSATAGRLVGVCVADDAPDAPAPRERRRGGGAGAGTTTKKDAASPAPRLAPGTLVPATVVATHALHVDLVLGPDAPAPGARARLHVTEAEGGTLISVGTATDVVILGPMATPAGRAHGVWEVTTRAGPVQAARDAGGVGPGDALKAGRPPTTADLTPGTAVVGFVQSATPDAAWVALSPTVRARLHVLDEAGSPEEVASFPARHPVGARVSATVARVDGARGDVDLSTRVVLGAAPPPPPSATPTPTKGRKRSRSTKTDPALPLGTPVLGIVRSIGGGGVRVQVGRHSYGRAALTDLADGWVANALAGLAPGVGVMAVPVGAAPAAGADAPLSLRASDGGWTPGGAKEREDTPAAAAAVAAAVAALGPAGPPPTLAPASLTSGAPAAGYVVDVGRGGAFVCLARGLDARVRLSDLAAGFVPDPAAAFPAGTLVVGKITSSSPAGASSSKVGMSLRDGGCAASVAAVPAAGGASAPHAAPSLAPGDVVTGRVRRVEAFGVFVDLTPPPAGAAAGGPPPALRAGLAHKSELADAFVGDPASLFRPGQVVRAVVLRTDAESGRISLTLRPSALKKGGGGGAGAGGAESEEEDDDVDAMAADASDDDASDDEDLRIDLDDGEEGEDSEGGGDMDAEGGEAEEAGDAPSPLCGGLDAGLAVGWGDADADAAAAAAAAAPSLPAAPFDDSDDGDAALPAAKKSRRAAKAAAAAAAADTDAAEAAIAARGAPTDPPSFERALAATPASSFLWIRYAAHMLSLGEPDDARGVLARALESIDLADTAARFNVFVARLNLEARAGEPVEGRGAATLAAFAACRRQTDSKALHLALLTILEKAGHASEAADAAGALVRAEKGSAKAWLAAHGLALRRGDSAGARGLVARATSSLPARKHVKFLSAAALAEFRGGDADRGRALYEGVLRGAPRRTDLWAAYADQEIRRGDPARVRALFERAVRSDGLAPRQVKFLFRRYLEYEKAGGDEGRCAHVREAARAYVERVGGGGEGGGTAA